MLQGLGSQGFRFQGSGFTVKGVRPHFCRVPFKG